MGSKRCRLYDENLVHNIMMSTGLSVLEYLRENANADSDEICDFVEANAEMIVSDTISHLKSMNDLREQTGNAGNESGDVSGKRSGEDSDSWPIKDEEE